MLGDHGGVDAATDIEFGGQAHEAGLAGRDQVGQDPVGDGFVESAFFAKRPDVHFQGLEFDAGLIGNVLDFERGKVRLAGFRAQAGEFRDADADGVIALRLWIIKDFQLF